MINENENEEVDVFKFLRFLYKLTVVVFVVALYLAYTDCHCAKLEYALMTNDEMWLHCEYYFTSLDDTHTASRMCRDAQFLKAWVGAYDSLIAEREEVLEGVVNMQNFEIHCHSSTTIVCYAHTICQWVAFPLFVTFAYYMACRAFGKGLQRRIKMI